MARQIERAADHYGSDRILVSSFAKSSVAELNTRQLPIPKEQIGTLHSLAFHALGAPKILETGKHLQEFSENCPAYAIEDATMDGIEDGYRQAGKTPGAKMLQEYAKLRALMRPRETWPDSIQGFAKEWEAFKSESHGMDFSDLIDTCLREGIGPKCDAAVAFIDEAR